MNTKKQPKTPPSGSDSWMEPPRGVFEPRFSVPEDYFDRLPSRVMARIEGRDAARPQGQGWIRFLPVQGVTLRWAAAASVCLALGLWLWGAGWQGASLESTLQAWKGVRTPGAEVITEQVVAEAAADLNAWESWPLGISSHTEILEFVLAQDAQAEGLLAVNPLPESEAYEWSEMEASVKDFDLLQEMAAEPESITTK